MENAGGQIISFFAGVAKIKDLPGVFVHETLRDERQNEVGLVVGFDEDHVEALFFNDDFNPDQRVFASGEIFTSQISDHHLGRVIDGVGQPLDGLGPVSGEKLTVFRDAPLIIDRQAVDRPLVTGVKIIDATLPLGRGQRELIIGDRKLGKSALAVDVIMNQKHDQKPVYCVYVLCGHKETKLRELVNLFEENNTFLYTIIVAAPASYSFAQQYLAPFLGCAIGEYFRDQGKDALVVFDDLSKHAKVYRDVSLLFDRPPGREAYPANIFSLHAGLLERAAQLSEEKGGGSLTALPIVETHEGDITSFIPTNLISITDGQIYLERGLFQKNFLPAVNVGLSVSRVGSVAQPKVLQENTKGIRLALAQHKELQKLSQLETVVSIEAQKKIHRGDLIWELLKQDKHTQVTWPEQVILFYVVEEGFFDDVASDQWFDFEKLLLELIRGKYFKLVDKILKGKFDDEIKEQITAFVNDAKQEFLNV